MYAVVEFSSQGDSRQCAVLPLLWLTDNMTKCYWPRVKTDEAFNKLVSENVPYKTSWATFPILRVLHTCDTQSDADLQMSHILENGTSDERSTVIHQVSKKKSVLDESTSSTSSTSSQNSEKENSPPPKKLKTHNGTNKKRSKSKTKEKKRKSTTDIESLSDDTEKHDGTNKKRSKSKTKEKKRKSTTDIESLSDDTDIVHSTPQRTHDRRTVLEKSMSHIEKATTFRSPVTDSSHRNRSHSQSSPTSRRDHTVRYRPVTAERDGMSRNSDTNSIRNQPHQDIQLQPAPPKHPARSQQPARSKQPAELPAASFQETIIRYLTQIQEEQANANTMCLEILRHLEANVRFPTKPTDMPDFPLKDIRTFEDLDQLLKTESNAIYLKNRLATIGGKDQRASVMGMMRLLMANELAMQFNWAGQHQKRSFKETTLMQVIFDAAKVLFQGKHKSSDKNIKSAVQDWLKLAKNRHSYNTATKTT